MTKTTYEPPVLVFSGQLDVITELQGPGSILTQEQAPYN